VSAAQFGRVRRLLQGWSANLLQVLLGITQQVALVPIFLAYWTGDTLAAWLSIYAAGNLILIADFGLHGRAINRFLALRANDNCDARTAQFFSAMLRIYLASVAVLAAVLLPALVIFPPSASLGFASIPNFDPAFGVMILGMLLTVLGNPVAALYRARGYYGRAVRLQCLGMLIAQLGQLAAVVITKNLLIVTVAYVAGQLVVVAYVLIVDAPRLFPFLRRGHSARSWRWALGQFRLAFPFALAGATELALANAPVLLVSAFVSDRLVVAQWGLTRVVAGLLRALCLQATLPLAAELGQDYAIGEVDKLQSLYARGSILVAVLTSVVASGLLAFWPDFFAIWTHGSIPYDPTLALTLMIGTAVAAPAILAASYAGYSDRGGLLALAKSLQLALFMVLSIALLPRLGPLGVAFAIVASDLLIQLAWFTVRILKKTLTRPVEHLLFVEALVVAVTLAGWGLGILIRWATPGEGLLHFVGECALWLVIVVTIASPLWKGEIRTSLVAAIPR
jgi:O-antigen/teichoic acid export membrane protein